jgi:ABC-type uncharacterized transport system fused permease/ATPase subunit
MHTGTGLGSIGGDDYLQRVLPSTPIGISQQFVQNRLALRSRDWLTCHLIGRYLSGHTFDRVSAKTDDNPDQRIAEDVPRFTSTLLSFVVMGANSALTTLALRWSNQPPSAGGVHWLMQWP